MNKNKRFEKFVNKNNNYTNQQNSLNLNLGRNYKTNQKTGPYQYNYTYKNTYFKNTYVNQTNFQNKRKLKLMPGMFSYKRSTNYNLNNSCDTNNSISKHNSSQLSNKNNYNNNYILFPNIKLLNDNTQNSSLRTLSYNDNISNNFPSISSLNLNKYRINSENNYKNRTIDIGNTFNNTNFNYDFLKYNNIIINNIQQPKVRSRSTETMNIKTKKRNRINSDQYNNKNENNESINNNYEYEIKTKNYFLGKTKSENESRRMIVEYLKVLKLKEKNKYKINNILKINHISYKVLNQQIILNNIINYHNKSLNNSFNSNYSKAIEAPKKKTNLKNINKFLNDMNDIKNDKIKMINFLSVPRIMELNFMQKNYTYIFMLVPNQLSYLKGLESYIFQWIDIKSRKLLGGFDLIKVNSCFINYQNDKKVLIETFDGVFHRQYELITVSNKIASYYVKSINYLSRLEKCKIYNKKYLYT